MEDILHNDGYNQATLSTALNKIPYLYNGIGKLGLFTDKSLNTSVVAIEQYDGQTGLIVSSDRGTAGSKNKRGKRSTRFFEVPRFRLEDAIKATDIQNSRAFGSDTELETVDSVILRLMEEMKRKHDITLEYMRAQAIQGQVLDGDGTVLYDLFDQFGITKKTLDMDFATSAAHILGVTNEATAHIEENLKGTGATGAVALCSQSFFNKMLANEEINAAYLAYTSSGQKQGNPMLSNVMKGFEYQDITWISYGAKAPILKSDGTTEVRKFIADDKAILVPTGTTGIFETHNAPADTLESVNQMGVPYTAWVDNVNKSGADLFTETNPLPLCNQPEVLVELTA